MGLIPNAEVEDREVSNYQLSLPNEREKRASRIQSKLEKSHFAKVFLLFATMLGTSMVIGDGVLTPCISGPFSLFFFLSSSSISFLLNFLLQYVLFFSKLILLFFF